MSSHGKGICWVAPLAGLLAFTACHEPVNASQRAAREAERLRRAAERPERSDDSKQFIFAHPGTMVWDRPVKVNWPDSRPPVREGDGAGWPGATLLGWGGAGVLVSEALAAPGVLSPERLLGTLHRPLGPPDLH